MKHYLIHISWLTLALCVALSVTTDVFLTWPNIKNILLATSVIGILAIGAAFVIASAGLDLSVGSLMAFCAVASLTITQAFGLHWGFVIPLCLASGALFGLINGALIGYLGLMSFIVTLGMLSIARGAAFVVTDGRPMYGLPEPLLFLGQGDIAGLPVPVIIFFLTGFIAHVLLRHTRFGRHTLAIGSHEHAVRRLGLNVNRHLVWLFGFSGLLAAIAGLLFMTRVNAADPSAGVMYELTAISAAIIGGTSLIGGRASIVGAMLGALLLGVLQNGLNLLNVPNYYQQLVLGLVLIVSVAIAQHQKAHHGTA